MKKIFLFLFAGGFFAFTACNNSVKVAGISNKDSIDKAQASAYSKAMQNKQLAMAAMEAFNKHDVNAGFKDFAADFLEYGDGSSKPMTLEPVKKFWNEVLVAFPDYKIDNIRYVAEGDWVVVWADCREHGRVISLSKSQMAKVSKYLTWIFSVSMEKEKLLSITTFSHLITSGEK